MAIFAAIPRQPHGSYTGALSTIYGYFLVMGVFTVTKSLPFGLMLGLSRRSYYLGTTLLVAVTSAVFGLVLTLLQVVERATGGWGLAAHFFRIPWLLDGRWYQTWLTSFVLLALFFLYGMWYGLVWRRWNLTGMLAFVAAQLLLALAFVMMVSLTHSWTGVGHYLATTTAVSLTGVLAAVALAMGFGGFATIRRVTI